MLIVRPNTGATPSTSNRRPLTHSPSTRSLAEVDERLNLSVAQANALSANSACRSRTASQIGFVHEELGGDLTDAGPSPSNTSRSGSRTGNGLSTRLFRIVNNAVTPPMPSASETTANSVTMGAARSALHA